MAYKSLSNLRSLFAKRLIEIRRSFGSPIAFNTWSAKEDSALFISALTSPGLSSAYNFSQITPSQIKQASSSMEKDGILTTSEATQLRSLGNASSFSPIGENASSTYSDTSWQSIHLNVLSQLQNEISVGAKEQLSSEGDQMLSTDQALLQKLSAYQSNASAESQTGSGNLVNQCV